MRYSIVAGLVFAVLLCSIMGFINNPNKPSEIRVTLHVTSTHPNDETTFDAGVVIGEERVTSRFGTFHTPYELSVTAHDGYVAGLFNKTEGNASLNVEIIIEQNGQRLNRLQGSGSVVVVSTIHDMLSSTENYSVRAF